MATTATLTVNCYLNARISTPSVTAPCTYYHLPADKIEITDVVIGDEIEGNSIWYKDAGQNYFWSGGFSETDFVLNQQAYVNLDFNRQIQIASALLDSILPALKNKITGLLGAGVALKQLGRQQAQYHSIVFYVTEKLDNVPAGQKIPASFNFRGYQISSDVVESPLPKASSIPMKIYGDSDQNIGTGGLFYIVEAKSYLLTNFHVLCKNSFSVNGVQITPSDNAVKVCITSDPGKAIGEISYATFSNNMDLAVVLVSDPNLDNSNNLPGNNPVNIKYASSATQEDSKSILLTDKTAYQTAHVYAFGAISGKQCRGKITAWGASKDVEYPGGTVTMQNLIVTTLISQSGDSGSVVYDKDGGIIGILFADNSKDATYVIPITSIYSMINFYEL